MSAASGNYTSWRPTPPQRGSFPLDHDGDCTQSMQEYLTCLKLVKGNNAPNCRILAKRYLKCRMEYNLMDQDSWQNLGLPDDAPVEQTTTYPVPNTDSTSSTKSS